MARLIESKHFDGAQILDGGRLRIWERIPVGGPRAARILEGDEADEACTEIRDMLAGQGDPGDDGAAPRKGRKGAR